jgi:CheY-like chemotaxis protein
MNAFPDRTILLVEDTMDDELLTVRAFKHVGMDAQVTVARDGVEALAYLFGTGDGGPAAPATLPSVVLLDLNLPRVGGFDVLRRIRQDPRTKLIPVVVLTSSNQEEDLSRSYSLGANGYVRKPVASVEFAEAVKHLGLFWLRVNQPPPLRGGGAVT